MGSNGVRGTFSILLLSTLASILTACSFPTLEAANNDTGSGPSSQPEPEYCSTVQTHSPAVTVSASALFYYRPVSVTLGLSGDPVSAGIPHAEVVVTNSSGSVVQCGETDDSGNISVQVPKVAGTYTLSVKSRASNAKIKVSVLEDIYLKMPYSISKTFSVSSSSSSVSAGTLEAKARASESSKIEGGAFNILYRIWQANEYIRIKTSNASFVADKVSVFWKMGFNPYTYYGHPDSLLSFYRNGQRELYILGGANGDVKSSDTDHFDNSVIIHEYGHFLEDVYARSDSPGGSHNGNFIIDPRLAWSEGWANFFQAAVLRQFDNTWKFYIDTIGFRNDSSEGGSGSIAIKVEMTVPGNTGTCASSGAFSVLSCDRVSVAGEGTFREMSISRFLFKTILEVADGGAEIPFSSLWTVFSSSDSAGSPVGLHSSQLSFRNIALFNSYLRGLIASNHSSLLTGWDNVRSDEKQNSDSRDYAETLNVQAANSCAQKSLSPVVDSTFPSTGQPRSNQLRSNDFYIYDHNGTNRTLRLEYTGGSSNMDLDLYIYQNDYLYQEMDDEISGDENGTVAVKSARLWSLEQGLETINLGSLPAGRYLINVKAYTYNKLSSQLTGTAQYRLKQVTGSTTEDLCPAH